MVFSEGQFIEGLVFCSSGGGALDIVLKVLSGMAGLIALSFSIYVVYLKRKWKRDEDLRLEKESSLRLEYENKIVALRAELIPRIDAAFRSSEEISGRIFRIEDTSSNLVDASNLHTLKYSFDNELLEVKRNFAEFKSRCSKRHEMIASLGSLTDLKARVDELSRKIDRLEDFRHNSADRYVLMVNYQQDTRMITDAIGVLRDDLRAVIDMVDKL